MKLASRRFVTMEPALKPGQIFDDKFELQAVLGAGGIGTVYKAIQLDCDRTVALKLLHNHIAEDEEYRARFLREAKALSRLQHPNIVTVYHLGLSFSGSPYLAMELIRGKSIRKLISDLNRLPTKLALGITRDVALALAFVHKEGIIHRDLKPDNIIIVDEPNPNTVKIIDFGLIHYTDKDQKLTATNELVGTVDYMSPEQCAGREITLHSDIYSLTVCFYEMLTGQKPFVADTAIGMMYKQINTPPPLIGSETVEMYHPILQELINTGLNKDPLKRFENMEAFAEKIDECLATIGEGKYKKPRKIPVVLLSSVVLIALGLACIPMLTDHKKQVKTERAKEQKVLSPSQEIENVRSELRESDNWLQDTILYHKAFKIISKDTSSSRITRATRLNMLNGYAKGLDNANLPAPAVTLRDKILNEVRAKGLPGDISSEPFGNDQVAEITRDNIKDLLKWGRKKEAQDLLQKAINPPPRHFLPILESTIRLHDDKLTSEFIDQISMPSEAIFAATLLRQENNMPLLERAMAVGRNTSADDETNNDSRAHSKAMFQVQDAFLMMMQGKPKKAVEAINKADLLNAGKKMSSDKKRKLFGTALSLLSFARDFDAAKTLVVALKPDDAPNWDVETFKDTKENYDSEVDKLVSLIESNAERNVILQQIDRIIASVKDPETKTLFMIQRAAKSRTDYLKAMYSTMAYDQSKVRGAKITPATSLAAKSLYARALNSADWKTESLRLLLELIDEVKRTGMPRYGDQFNDEELFICQALATNILAEWGRIDEAREVLPKLPAQLSDRTPWRELFDAEMSLNNESAALRLIENCTSIYDFQLMSFDSISKHNYKLAEACMQKCEKLLLDQQTKPSSLTARLIAATIRLDQGRAQEAQTYIKPVLGQLPEYAKTDPYAVRPLIVAADLSGLDVSSLTKILEDKE